MQGCDWAGLVDAQLNFINLPIGVKRKIILDLYFYHLAKAYFSI